MPRTSSAAQRQTAADPEPDQALSHLLIRMANDVTRLRQEVERNRQEVRALSRAAPAASQPVADEPATVARLFDAAGFTGYMAILLLAFAFAFLLDLVMSTWLAFLIVGALFAGGAYALYRRGEDRAEDPATTPAPPAPPATPASPGTSGAPASPTERIDPMPPA